MVIATSTTCALSKNPFKNSRLALPRRHLGDASAHALRASHIRCVVNGEERATRHVSGPDERTSDEPVDFYTSSLSD